MAARATTTTQTTPAVPTVRSATPGSWADTQWTAGPSSESKVCPAMATAARAVAWLNSVDRMVRTLESETRQSATNAIQSTSSTPGGESRRPGSLRFMGVTLSSTRRPARKAGASRRSLTTTPPGLPSCRQRSSEQSLSRALRARGYPFQSPPHDHSWRVLHNNLSNSARGEKL